MDQENLLAVALLDEETSSRIKAWKTVICQHLDYCDLLPPHITLGMYSGLQSARLESWAASFAAAQTGLEVHFASVGVFSRRVCFLAPRVDTALLRFHAGFHQKCSEFLTPNWQVGQWVAHSTLYLGDWPGMQKALPAALQNFVPLTGRITAIGIGSEMHPLKIFPLAGA